MLSRRKVFGWVSGLLAGSAGVATVARTVSASDIGRVMLPGPYKQGPLDEFARYQKWFRDNPDMVWASRPMAHVVMRAGQLSESFAAANPMIEYVVWLDHVTDNVLLKARRLDRKVTGMAISLGVAITRHAIEEDANLDAWITEQWTILTAEVNEPTARAVVPEGGASYFLPKRNSACLS